MIATLQRTYSKAKAIANGVTWTAQQPIPVVFNADGLLSCGTFGLYRTVGRPMYCSAYQIDFTVPATDPGMLVETSLLDGSGIIVPGSLMKIYGCTSGQLQIVTPPFLVNTGDSLQVNVQIISGIAQYLPQDAILTYYLNFSNGLPGYALWP